jgi:hypothetical protein
LCYLYGSGCYPDRELAIKWILWALDSRHPIVIQTLLQCIGLDVSEVSGECPQFEQSVCGKDVGKNLDRIFGEPKKTGVADRV